MAISTIDGTFAHQRQQRAAAEHQRPAKVIFGQAAPI